MVSKIQIKMTVRSLPLVNNGISQRLEIPLIAKCGNKEIFLHSLQVGMFFSFSLMENYMEISEKSNRGFRKRIEGPEVHAGVNMLVCKPTPVSPWFNPKHCIWFPDPPEVISEQRTLAPPGTVPKQTRQNKIIEFPYHSTIPPLVFTPKAY